MAEANTEQLPVDCVSPAAIGGRSGKRPARGLVKPIDIAVTRLQRIALTAIRAARGRGLTTHELAAVVNIHRDAIQPRTSELRKLGLIRDSGGRRQNFSGKFAIVWVAGVMP